MTDERTPSSGPPWTDGERAPDISLAETPEPRFCTSCGSGLPRRARFCPQCGASAADPNPPSSTCEPEPDDATATPRATRWGERRHVAILLADVQDYTSLAETLDPEDVAVLMNRLLSGLAQVVHHHQGHVDSFIGDAVLALFGAPVAYENDPERAVLAGLAMLKVVDRHNAERDVGIALRVGVHLGEVAIGSPGTREEGLTMLGDALEVVSAVESCAEPGSVLVSEAVRRRIDDGFELREGPPVSPPNGKPAVRTFRVGRARPLDRRAVRSDEPFGGTNSFPAIGSGRPRFSSASATSPSRS